MIPPVTDQTPAGRKIAVAGCRAKATQVLDGGELVDVTAG
jgi:hypothetical protein